MKRFIASTFDGYSFWVPSSSNTLDMKLPVEKTMLRHQILDHIGNKDLKTLKKKYLVEGIDDSNIEFNSCKHCIYGKQKHVQFYSNSHNFSRLLDLIDSNIFEPVNIPLNYKTMYLYHSLMHTIEGHLFIFS